MATKKRASKAKGKAKPTVPEAGENTTVRLPGWQTAALDEVVEELNDETGANVNRSHLIRTAVTQYLIARGYKKPHGEA